MVVNFNLKLRFSCANNSIGDLKIITRNVTLKEEYAQVKTHYVNIGIRKNKIVIKVSKEQG